MVRIDLASKKITASVRVGRQPFGLSLSPDRKTAFVANVGMYEYPLITGANPSNYDSLMISHHPYGDSTFESINGTVIEGRNIPGVGSPLHPDAMSVFTIDLETNTVTDKFKTGHQIGHMIEDLEVVGGASPNSIAIGTKFAYVSNATNDNISVIDYRNHEIAGHIPITVDKRIDSHRGLLPFGITLSNDEKSEVAPFDINGLVQEAVDAVRRWMFPALQATLQLDPGVPPVLVNRLQTEKVIINLVANGVEVMQMAGAAASETRISVSVEAKEGMAHVGIRDYGPGLDPETAHRIFEPFFSTKRDGMGLGLAISRSLIEAQGGELWVETERAPGTEFHCTLPLAHD